MKRFLLLVLLFIWILSGLVNAAEYNVTFIPQWRPQAQFAGYYVAYKKGFYKKYGLNVKILAGGPDAPSTEYLKDGKSDFATMWLSTAIRMKANGVDLVNIAQILQRTSLALVAWRSKVKTIQDLDGKKIGVWGSSFMIPLKAFINRYRINTKIIPQMGSINLFLRGGVDVATAMWYNEYDTIINSGVEKNQLTTFMFYKYGLNFPEDGIYVLKSMYDEHPDICRKFVKASIEGWLYAFKHKKEAVKIVMGYMTKAHVPANTAHQSWMLNAIEKAFFYNSKDSVGILKNTDYISVSKILKKEGFINTIPDFKNFFKGCRVKK